MTVDTTPTSCPLPAALVRKRHFLRHLYIKRIILPRQARDKHRVSTQKRVAFSLRDWCGKHTRPLPSLVLHCHSQIWKWKTIVCQDRLRKENCLTREDVSSSSSASPPSSSASFAGSPPAGPAVHVRQGPIFACSDETYWTPTTAVIIERFSAPNCEYLASELLGSPAWCEKNDEPFFGANF